AKHTSSTACGGTTSTESSPGRRRSGRTRGRSSRPLRLRDEPQDAAGRPPGQKGVCTGHPSRQREPHTGSGTEVLIGALGGALDLDEPGPRAVAQCDHVGDAEAGGGAEGEPVLFEKAVADGALAIVAAAAHARTAGNSRIRRSSGRSSSLVPGRAPPSCLTKNAVPYSWHWPRRSRTHSRSSGRCP